MAPRCGVRAASRPTRHGLVADQPPTSPAGLATQGGPVHLPAQPLVVPAEPGDLAQQLTGGVEGDLQQLGGADVLTYREMMQGYARVAGLPKRRIQTVPLLTPRLSSAWLALVTDVNLATARNLVDSMTTEVVVHERAIEQLVPGPPIGYDEAVRLAESAAAMRHDIFTEDALAWLDHDRETACALALPFADADMRIIETA